MDVSARSRRCRIFWGTIEQAWTGFFEGAFRCAGARFPPRAHKKIVVGGGSLFAREGTYACLPGIPFWSRIAKWRTGDSLWGLGCVVDPTIDLERCVLVTVGDIRQVVARLDAAIVDPEGQAQVVENLSGLPDDAAFLVDCYGDNPDAEQAYFLDLVRRLAQSSRGLSWWRRGLLLVRRAARILRMNRARRLAGLAGVSPDPGPPAVGPGLDLIPRHRLDTIIKGSQAVIDDLCTPAGAERDYGGKRGPR